MVPGKAQSIYAINNTIGVSTVVYCGYQALPIPLSIISHLKQKADESGEIDVPKNKIPDFPGKPGDKIKFAEHSPFSGLIAQLMGLDNTGKLVVEVEQMLGSARLMTIARSDVGAVIRKDGSTTAL